MSTDIAVRAAADMNATLAYADELAKSLLLPAQYRKQPANVLYAIEYGRMIGLSPMAAITGVHVIEGKPTASAALISGLVRQAGHKLRVRGDDRSATAQIVRSDDPDFVFEVTWTIDMARGAGLANKAVWKQYPGAMLKARAITQVARDACEEVLFGLHYTPEELGAEVDEDGAPAAAPPQSPSVDRRDQVVASAGQHRPQMTRTHTSEPVADQWSTPVPDGVEDAEIVPEQPDEPMSAHEQHIEISDLFKSELGVTDRAEKVRRIGESLGRPITTTKQLTYAEADHVVGGLRTYRKGRLEREQLVADFQVGIEGAGSMAELNSVGEGMTEALMRKKISATDRAELLVLWGERSAAIQGVAAQAPAEAEMAGASA